jgi:hypothetical protein
VGPTCQHLPPPLILHKRAPLHLAYRFERRSPATATSPRRTSSHHWTTRRRPPDAGQREPQRAGVDRGAALPPWTPVARDKSRAPSRSAGHGATGGVQQGRPIPDFPRPVGEGTEAGRAPGYGSLPARMSAGAEEHTMGGGGVEERDANDLARWCRPISLPFSLRPSRLPSISPTDTAPPANLAPRVLPLSHCLSPMVNLTWRVLPRSVCLARR